MYYKHHVLAFIGPACAFAFEPVARLAAYWNRPIITGMGDQVCYIVLINIISSFVVNKNNIHRAVRVSKIMTHIHRYIHTYIHILRIYVFMQELLESYFTIWLRCVTRKAKSCWYSYLIYIHHNSTKSSPCRFIIRLHCVESSSTLSIITLHMYNET